MQKDKIFTFPQGGIHPEKYKLSSDSPIEDVPLPETVYISMAQHRGKPAKPVVAKGDKVKVGTLIGEADGDFSANIHSSVSGEVKKIDTILNEFGFPQTAVVIKVEGDEWEEEIDCSQDIVADITKDKEEIIAAVKKAGIIGLSGSAFPTAVKLNVPAGKRIDTIILNGIECEPYFTTDDRVMQEKAEEIVIGARILNKVFGIQNAIVAIDENKPKAIEIMKNVTSRYIGVNVAVCETKYPQGSEKQLIKAITGREVPPGMLPADVGCLVQNVGTVFAIYEAVQKNKPIIDSIITVAGEYVETPRNFYVRVGTPVSFLLEHAKADYKNAEKIIFGGPMMGRAAINIDAPTSKTSAGILLFGKKSLPQKTTEECMRCARCVEGCPMGLQPYLIADNVKDNNVAELKKLNVMSCIECGCCTYSCPAKIRLLDYCKIAKAEIMKQK